MKKICLIFAIFIFSFTLLKAQKRMIGEKLGGGIVFDVSADGLHGLIAQTIDQAKASNWLKATKVVTIQTNYSPEAKGFSDWRLPTEEELKKLYMQKNIVGGFAKVPYWSSSEEDEERAWSQHFNTGAQICSYKANTAYVRAVRSF